MVKLFTVFFFFLSLPVFSQSTLQIAVAANFKPALAQLLTEFQQQHQVVVHLSSASTGVLFTQIKHGAPYDIFFAADAFHPSLLEKQQLILANSRKTYALGRLALWGPRLQKNTIRNLSFLAQWQGKIAIANPRVAPYGIAAQQLLQRLNLWETLQKKLIKGQNIAQVYQFIDSGNIPLGLVALSQVINQKNSSYLLIPENSHKPIKQQFVILKKTKYPQLALQFSRYITSVKIQHQIRSLGYSLSK